MSAPGGSSPVGAARTTLGAVRGPLLVAGLGLGAAALLHLRDPHEAGSYGFCPFLALTGVPCPGCGGLRAVNDLTRGDVVGALSSNAMAVVLVVVLGVVWARWFAGRLDGRPSAGAVTVAPQVVVLGVAVTVAFGVLRITPWGAWLAP